MINKAIKDNTQLHNIEMALMDRNLTPERRKVLRAKQQILRELLTVYTVK